MADSLNLKLVGAEKHRIKATRTKNPEAYDEYLRGLYFLHKSEGEKILRNSIRHFERALELDPSYAAAMAGLAGAFGNIGYFNYEPKDKAYARSKELSLKALALDDTIPEAHYTMGTEEFFVEGNFDKAEKYYLRAIELNPNLADAHMGYAFLLNSLGGFDDSIREIKKVIELDPLSADAQDAAGAIYSMAGKYAEALVHLERAQEMEPGRHTNLGVTLVDMGRIEEGVKELEKGLEKGGSAFFKSNLGYAYGAAGRREDALRIVKELRAASKDMPLSYELAQVYAGLGDKEEALNCLEKSYDERTIFVFPMFSVEPFFATLREEPRFKALEKKLGLDKHQAAKT